MSSLQYYIVGDRFKNFSCNDGVMTVSDFIQSLKENPDKHKGKSISFGQGLSKESKSMIRYFMDYYSVTGIDDESIDESTISKTYVHKHKDHNVLLSRPVKLSASEYHADLLIDERCAEISDHMTGQHVQGMVLAEAARQMFIGVTEAFLIPKELIGDVTYIFNKMNIEYSSFVFPLPIKIRYHILSSSSKRPGNIKSTVKIDFFQNDILCCSSDIDFSTYNSSFIAKLEGDKARESVEHATASHSDNEDSTVVALT